jgi:hypothetical protein
MQSIAASCCVAFFAALLLQDWVQVCCLAQPKQYRSPWKRIWERSSTISNRKLKQGLRDRLGLRGRRRGPIDPRIAPIIGIAGVAVGFAGGTAAVANAAGAGGDDPSAGNCGEV